MLHALQKCFLLIELTAWDFPEILNGFMALLPGRLLFPFKQTSVQSNVSLVLLKTSGFLGSRNPDAGFPALIPWHPLPALISQQ